MPVTTKLEEQQQSSKSLLDVRLAAKIFGVSTSWIRRHIGELSAIRAGRFIRFDAELLSDQLRARIEIGKPLKPERTDMFFRYQRGFVYQKGRKARVWYGVFREDVRMHSRKAAKASVREKSNPHDSDR